MPPEGRRKFLGIKMFRYGSDQKNNTAVSFSDPITSLFFLYSASQDMHALTPTFESYTTYKIACTWNTARSVLVKQHLTWGPSYDSYIPRIRGL